MNKPGIKAYHWALVFAYLLAGRVSAHDLDHGWDALLETLTSEEQSYGVLYVPKSHHLTVPQCIRSFDQADRERTDWKQWELWLREHPKQPTLHQLNEQWCKEHGGADIPEDCREGWHQEQQQACYGYGAAEIPTFRTVCHEDSARGAKEPCGLDCAQGTR